MLACYWLSYELAIMKRLLGYIAFTALSCIPFLSILQTEPPSKHVVLASTTTQTVKTAVVSPVKPTAPAHVVAQAAVPLPTPVIQQTPVIEVPDYPTDHAAIMAQAGIAASDYEYVNWTIQKESSWNVHATEPTTGACHLEQSLPCSKDGCTTLDAVCQLAFANRYVLSRYGSWINEIAFHKLHGWY